MREAQQTPSRYSAHTQEHAGFVIVHLLYPPGAVPSVAAVTG
jgi:hypothetical protein